METRLFCGFLNVIYFKKMIKKSLEFIIEFALGAFLEKQRAPSRLRNTERLLESVWIGVNARFNRGSWHGKIPVLHNNITR